jgi:CHASE3 domain sensor protein
VSVQWVSHTNEVLTRLEAVLSTLKDAETGQRGYLLAGEASYLEPYREAVDRLPGQIAALRQLTLDNPPQTARVLRLDELATQRMAILSAASISSASIRTGGGGSRPRARRC